MCVSPGVCPRAAFERLLGGLFWKPSRTTPRKASNATPGVAPWGAFRVLGRRKSACEDNSSEGTF
eukprot:10718409-Alexandrium_andersonii.AAC.1